MTKKTPFEYTWSGRFSEPVSQLTAAYTASITFDYRLWRQDIQASLVHAEMLKRQQIINEDEFSAIARGLAQITTEIEEDRFQWSIELEDIHLNIESRLTHLVGDAGKRLHTGRSRNDQIATDIRLYVRDALDAIDLLLADLVSVFLQRAEEHAATPMPGFTHLQVAQPITVGHHLLAYAEMLVRDRARFQQCRQRMNQCPLGAAALAGTSFPIDREWVAKQLGFDSVCHNSLDAVSDRDFAIEFCAHASILMTHLSRLSEELIVWSNPAFGFVHIPDRFCTGSSIMPQKKNPDIPELARGKTGRVFGHLQSLLVLMKGQPLAYNKDNQEDKEPLFDTIDTVSNTLLIFCNMMADVRFNHKMLRQALNRGFATATDVADYLVKKGLPFRDAHAVVGRVVKHAESQQLELADLDIESLQRFSPLFNTDVHQILTIEGSLAARNHIGGTAPEQVRQAIKRMR